MRVLITGASGFVGRWLTSELEAAGHEAVPLSAGVDVRDRDAVRSAIGHGRPTAIAHLAAVAYAPDAAADPDHAFDVAVTGTLNVLDAMTAQADTPALLVTGSSEIYGAPSPIELPLTERSPVRPETPYARAKSAQEATAMDYAARRGWRVIVTRSFNHAGAGQRGEFVVAALARRVLEVARGRATDIPVGNAHVRRDISDVRDVVRAYRLLLERASADGLGTSGLVVNVCSGRSETIEWIVDELCRQAGVRAPMRTDPALVRANDALEIRGDYSLLRSLTGWQPTIPLEQTLAGVWSEVATTKPAVAG
jgi:GDP-4-dehydro-6-deoxy-D-mannose reductase